MKNLRVSEVGVSTPAGIRAAKIALIAALSMVAPEFALMPMLPLDVNFMGVVLTSVVLVITGVFVILVSIAARKAKKPLIKTGTAWAVAIVGGLLLLVGVVTYNFGPAGPVIPNVGQSLTALALPSVDTTASLPGSPYTACTSLTTLTKVGATGSQAGVVWTTSNGLYNAAPGGSMAGGGFLYKATTAVTKSGGGAGGFMDAECFQMAFSFQYNPSPINAIGQVFKAPVMLKINSITYTVLQFNNGTTINFPVFAQMPATNGGQDWGLLILSGTSVWQPACAEYKNAQVLPTSGCNAVQVDNNDGTTQDTFKLDVIVNVNGPFSYDTSYSPVGKQLVISFALGLPSGTSGAQNNYMNWIPYTLTIQRTT